MLTSEETLYAIKQMHQLIPNPTSDLEYEDPFHMLVAVILSAQSTDKVVNMIMPDLIKHFPTAIEMSKSSPQEIEPYIQSIGLYRNKAKYLNQMAKKLIEDFNGHVPNSRKELESLPGVGRKTANVILSVVFGIPAFAVDTHVERITKRLRMVPQDATAKEIELIMTHKLPKEWWSISHQLIVLFGRYHSKANSKECAELIGMTDIVNNTSID